MGEQAAEQVVSYRTGLICVFCEETLIQASPGAVTQLVTRVNQFALQEHPGHPCFQPCDGSGGCMSGKHIHGCYADRDGSRCDDPEDHHA